tara:strand:+ start:859 stop:1008 length:150 start_codon:yes stop_codon:yes gene_type:complete
MPKPNWPVNLTENWKAISNIIPRIQISNSALGQNIENRKKGWKEPTKHV